ncbi:unnamed protein product [Porites lobata]|uniref:CHAT domain-containing protein n=1 Tax=Porites lobata TaxID=104759 RepID=A0ABN8PT85_9CNID|nr:unnamed protein product [Porites lobata]
MLLKLEKIEEALYAAEEGRAQALVDDLKIHYGLTGPPVQESKETISDLLKECATQMVFIGLERNKINFWVLGKGVSVELRTKEIEGGREGTDFVTDLKLIITSLDDCHSKSGALLVGNPCLDMVTKCGKPVFKKLENAEKEVKKIGGILKVQPLTGKEATKQTVLDRITSVALVHIAAHGKKETGEIALAPNAGWEEGQEPRSKKKAPKEEDYILNESDV